MKRVYLTESEAVSLKDFIENAFTTEIKNREEAGCDTSLLWVYNIINIYEKCGGLNIYSDYEPRITYVRDDAGKIITSWQNNVIRNCTTCKYHNSCDDCRDCECGTCQLPCAYCHDAVYNNWEKADEIK